MNKYEIKENMQALREEWRTLDNEPVEWFSDRELEASRRQEKIVKELVEYRILLKDLEDLEDLED